MPLKDQISDDEVLIVEKLLESIREEHKKNYLMVEVWTGGDEPDLVCRADDTRIEDHIGVSGETRLIITMLYQPIMWGVIEMIHGNGYDLIADVGTSPTSEDWFNALIEPAMVVARDMADADGVPGIELPDEEEEDFSDAIDFTTQMANLKLPEEDAEFAGSGMSLDDYIDALPHERIMGEFEALRRMIAKARKIVRRENGQ